MRERRDYDAAVEEALMDWLTFIASLVDALALPATVVAVTLVLRRPIARLLTSQDVKRVKAGPGGVEIEYWDSTIEEAQTELAPSTANPQTVDALPPAAHEVLADADADDDFMEDIKSLARVAPRAAVLESFARLELVLRAAVEPALSGAIERRPMAIRALARLATEQGLLTQAELAAFTDVARLRNIAAHEVDFDLSTERAVAFADLVRQLIIAVSLAQGRTVQDGAMRSKSSSH